MAKISTPALTPRMYRHFAVVTLVGTLLLAIFSSGENRQAISDRIEAEQAAAKARRDATRVKYGTPKLVRAAPASARTYDQFSDYSDNYGSFGAPMDATGSEVQEVGSLSAPSAKCAKGQFVEVERSSEDVEVPTRGKCIGRSRTASASEGQGVPAGRNEQVNALVAATLRNAQAGQTGK